MYRSIVAISVAVVLMAPVVGSAEDKAATDEKGTAGRSLEPQKPAERFQHRVKDKDESGEKENGREKKEGKTKKKGREHEKDKDKDKDRDRGKDREPEREPARQRMM